MEAVKNFSYVDAAFEHMVEGDDQAPFWRAFHWGLFADPENLDDDPDRYYRAGEAMTAALYNGGSHNVKRMLAGLIRTLPETEKYMRKVPATRRRLDGVIAGAALGEAGVRTLR